MTIVYWGYILKLFDRYFVIFELWSDRNPNNEAIVSRWDLQVQSVADFWFYAEFELKMGMHNFCSKFRPCSDKVMGIQLRIYQGDYIPDIGTHVSLSQYQGLELMVMGRARNLGNYITASTIIFSSISKLPLVVVISYPSLLQNFVSFHNLLRRWEAPRRSANTSRLNYTLLSKFWETTHRRSGFVRSASFKLAPSGNHPILSRRPLELYMRNFKVIGQYLRPQQAIIVHWTVCYSWF